MKKKIIISLTKYLHPLVLLLIILDPPIILWYAGFGREWTAIYIALWLGVIGVFQSQIGRWFFPPLLSYYIKGELTRASNIESQKWYHLAIKNNGFTPVKGVKVKIRDEENKVWVNLTLPFRDVLMKRGEDITRMNNLSIGEENYFDVGFMQPSNDFTLMIHIEPYNQKWILAKDEKQEYFLEITADNTNPQCFKVLIKNEGYEKFNASSIKVF
jgi:hypothetical protein